MEPRIQYAKTDDGVSIAYASVGHGPALVVLPAVAWIQFSLFHDSPQLRPFYDQLGQGRRLVYYDQRGFGLSQRELDDDLWTEPGVTDLEAVFQALHLRPAALFASTFAGPTAISYAVRHPDEVSHLILYGTFSRASDVMPKEQADALINLARTDWHTAAQLFADMSAREPHPEESLEVAAIFRESADGENVARLLEGGADVDFDDLLHRVRCKTLVIHRRADGFMPFRTGQKLAAQIPNAQLVPLEGSVHPYQHESGAILAAIEQFLTGKEPSPATPHIAANMYTIFFTDMESSTATTQRLGDEKAQELVRAHNAIVREALGAHGGNEIKHTGDGIMASFPSASSALECAIAIQRAVAALRQAQDDHAEQVEARLNVRIGLNAGEPIAEDQDLFGTAVQLARRICDQAAPDEILASNVVRELAAGKGFLFSDRGEVVPKGFDEAVRLYEVRWQENV